MYSITYTLLGTARNLVHRSKDAEDAVATIDLIHSGSGTVIRIIDNSAKRQISVAELQLLARREAAPASPRRRFSFSRFLWQRR